MYNLEEQNLIEKTKNGDGQALMELTSLHSGILHNIIKSYSLPYKALASFQEFFSDRFEIVYNAAITWKPERGQFNTHAGISAKFHCLRQMKKLVYKDESNCENEELTIAKDLAIAHLDKNLDDISDYLKLLDSDEMIQVLKLRYEENLTWQRIGDLMGFTHTFAQIVHNNSLKIIKKRMSSRLKELI